MRSQIIRLAEAGALDGAGFERAMELGGVRPDGARWLAFVRAACLIGGALLMGAALIYFIAYNWHGMTRLVKIALLGLAMALSAGGAIAFSPRATTGRACLVFAVLSLGALLAFVGQTYQTGADPWQLFAAWAVLSLPWALAAAWAPVWVMVLVIVDVAVTLYLGMQNGGAWGPDYAPVVTTLALVHAAVAATAEAMRERAVWRLLPRFAAVTALAFGTLAALYYLDGSARPGRGNLSGMAVFAIVLALGWWQYRMRSVDRMVLAAGALGAITVATVAVAKALHSMRTESYMLLALMMIGLSAAAAHWLRGLAAESVEDEGELA